MYFVVIHCGSTGLSRSPQHVKDVFCLYLLVTWIHFTDSVEYFLFFIFFAKSTVCHICYLLPLFSLALNYNSKISMSVQRYCVSGSLAAVPRMEARVNTDLIRGGNWTADRIFQPVGNTGEHRRILQRTFVCFQSVSAVTAPSCWGKHLGFQWDAAVETTTTHLHSILKYFDTQNEELAI